MKEQKSGARDTGQQLLNELEGLLERPREVFRDRPNLVAEVEADLGRGSQRIVIKRFGWRNRAGFLLSPLRRSKAFRSRRAALHLLAHQIPTPLPIKVVEQRKLGFLLQDLYVTESLGPKVNLRNYLQEVGWEERKRVLGIFGSLLRRMHDSGFCHRDPRLNNVFIRRGEFPPEKLYFVDLNRAKLKGRVYLWGRTTDLVKIKLGPIERKVLLESYSKGDYLYYRRIARVLRFRDKLLATKVRIKRWRDRNIYRPLGIR